MATMPRRLAEVGAGAMASVMESGAPGARVFLARPLQDGEEEAVGPVAVRVELQAAVAGGRDAERRGAIGAEERRERRRPQPRLALGEVRDLVVLGPADRAGGVHEPSAGLDEPREAHDERPL